MEPQEFNDSSCGSIQCCRHTDNHKYVIHKYSNPNKNHDKDSWTKYVCCYKCSQVKMKEIKMSGSDDDDVYYLCLNAP